jgi:hypothetical protein
LVGKRMNVGMSPASLSMLSIYCWGITRVFALHFGSQFYTASVGLQVVLLCPCIIHQPTQTQNQHSANESTPRTINIMQSNSRSQMCWSGSIIVHFVSQRAMNVAPRKKSRLTPTKTMGAVVIWRTGFNAYQGSLSQRDFIACLGHWPVRLRVQGSLQIRSVPAPGFASPASMLAWLA